VHLSTINPLFAKASSATHLIPEIVPCRLPPTQRIALQICVCVHLYKSTSRHSSCGLHATSHLELSLGLGQHLTVRGLQVVLARDLVQGLERVKIVLLHLLLSPPTHIRQREIVLSRTRYCAPEPDIVLSRVSRVRDTVNAEGPFAQCTHTSLKALHSKLITCHAEFQQRYLHISPTSRCHPNCAREKSRPLLKFR